MVGAFIGYSFKYYQKEVAILRITAVRGQVEKMGIQTEGMIKKKSS